MIIVIPKWYIVIYTELVYNCLQDNEIAVLKYLNIYANCITYENLSLKRGRFSNKITNNKKISIIMSDFKFAD